MKKIFLSLFLLPLLAFGQQEMMPLQTPLQKARYITSTLCSETYFGRGYVKSGDSLAAVFLAEEFKKRGLKSFGKSYMQPFSFDVNTFPGKMEVIQDGKVLVPAIDYLVDPNSGSSKASLQVRNIPVSEIVDAFALQELFKSAKAKHDWNAVTIDIRTLKNDSLKKARSLAFSMAELCDVLVITDEKFTFSVGQEPLAHALVYIQGKVFLEGKSMDLNIENVFVRNHQANNIVALLPAAKKAKKKPTLVFSAHYDHLGGMGSETYFPGGNDNASGTSMLFTLADYFKGNPVPYNVVFIAFAGEEAGLLGSHYYVENPLFDLKKIKFLLNLDIMGSGEDGITVVNGTLFPKEFDALTEINNKDQLLKQVKKRGTAANSDHYWFTEKGVPAFFIYTMGENKNYHDVLDTYEALSFSEYEDIVKLIAGFVKTL